MKGKKYVIGVDFGSDSVRSILVEAANGDIIASSVSKYKRWSDGKFCDPKNNQFRQHPLDYIEGLEDTLNKIICSVSDDVRTNIVSIGIDTTGSTPCPVDKNAKPLALLEEFKENPNAMFILWKDHTSIDEAELINEQAHNNSKVDYTKYSGGVYSSEWFWAKLLHIFREDTSVREAAYSWVEHSDWIPALLTGVNNTDKIKRNKSAAGFKSMWHREWEGLPPKSFFESVDPLFNKVKHPIYNKTSLPGESAGRLSTEWAEKLNLSEEVIVSTGILDAPAGAIGGGISKNKLFKIMGTSTCDMVVIPEGKLKTDYIPGISAQVSDGIKPGMIGLEAGQSAFGDIFSWFVNFISWPLEALNANNLDISESKLLKLLTEKAKKIDIKDSKVMSIDWFNGRRTPYANQKLKGLISDLTLGTEAPEIFRSLLESACFGSRHIIEHFQKSGVDLDEVIALGGIPKKNEFLIQMMSDIINIPIKISKTSQASALGAATLAAVTGNIYTDLNEAIEYMSSDYIKTYFPQPNKVNIYNKKYEKYLKTAHKYEKLF